MRKPINISEWLNETETAKKLGIKKRSLQVAVCKGNIPESAIKRPKVGEKMYHIPTIIGLN